MTKMVPGAIELFPPTAVGGGVVDLCLHYADPIDRCWWGWLRIEERTFSIIVGPASASYSFEVFLPECIPDTTGGKVEP